MTATKVFAGKAFVAGDGDRVQRIQAFATGSRRYDERFATLVRSFIDSGTLIPDLMRGRGSEAPDRVVRAFAEIRRMLSPGEPRTARTR